MKYIPDLEIAMLENKTLFTQSINFVNSCFGSIKEEVIKGRDFKNVYLEELEGITVLGISKIDIPIGLRVIALMIKKLYKEIFAYV